MRNHQNRVVPYFETKPQRHRNWGSLALEVGIILFTAPPSPDPQDHPAALRAATFSDSDAQKNDARAAGAVTAPNWSVSQLGLLLVFSKAYDFPSKLARSKWLMQDPQRETTSILQFIRMYLHVLLVGMVYNSSQMFDTFFFPDFVGRLNQHISQHEWINQWVTLKTTNTQNTS